MLEPNKSQLSKFIDRRVVLTADRSIRGTIVSIGYANIPLVAWDGLKQPDGKLDIDKLVDSIAIGRPKGNDPTRYHTWEQLELVETKGIGFGR